MENERNKMIADALVKLNEFGVCALPFTLTDFEKALFDEAVYKILNN